MKQFKRVLIANRGEIACRIIQTLNKLNIQALVIYAHSDKDALFTELASKAIPLEGEHAVSAYLDIKQIIKIAKNEQVDAIHPGYGFLSENQEFAKACQKANIVFIGAPIKSLKLMANKDEAKTYMTNANIPVIPGFHQHQDPKILHRAAKDIGFPVLIKPVAGGGGKGMKIVYKAHDFIESLKSAKREAKNAFGNDDVLIEKLIQQPRHIEVQVFADNHGNCVHLFERDCSLQRRHQKIIEEAPAPGISKQLKQSITQTAVKAAQAIEYLGAGTIEFLVDETESFYFMEMNTRLQVEHPVTEMITGIDLVDWQIQIAQGHPLPLKQSQIKCQGHAIEARVYAEDPFMDFLPSTGVLNYYSLPKTSPTVRIDNGFRQNDLISPDFDPMLAKIITHGKNRNAAISQMKNALTQTQIAGVKTNLAFLYAILLNAEFCSGTISTGLIEQNIKNLNTSSTQINIEALSFMALALIHLQERTKNPWHQETAWSNTPTFKNRKLTITVNADEHSINIFFLADHIKITDGITQLWITHWEQHNQTISLTTQTGQCLQATVIPSPNQLTHHLLFFNAKTFNFAISSGIPHHIEKQDTNKNLIKSPITATIHAVFKKKNDKVKKGDRLLILEAMKMEHIITAPANAEIKSILVNSGDQVKTDQLLVEFK